MGEQGHEGLPSLFAGVEPQEPGACPSGLALLSYLPWPKSEPGLQLLGNSPKDPGLRLHWSPAGGRDWGYSWGNAERAVLPPDLLTTQPHTLGRQTLHRTQTLSGPEASGRRRGSCPGIFSLPQLRRGGVHLRQGGLPTRPNTWPKDPHSPPPLSSTGLRGPLASVDLGM